METAGLKEFVDELRVQWKLLWRNRIDDKIRAEGIANQDYSKLFVDRGTIIIATRDYKPPDFVEILQQHLSSSDADKLIPPNPAIGGWGKFVRNALKKQKGLTRRPPPPKPERKKDQQLKKGGRGWLHFKMR